MNSLEKLAVLMDKSSPEVWLALKSRGKISEYECKLLDDAQNEFALASGVINAEVDYTVLKTDRLPKNYLSAILSTLNRKGYKTAFECLTFLKMAQKPKKMDIGCV